MMMLLMGMVIIIIIFIDNVNGEGDNGGSGILVVLAKYSVIGERKIGSTIDALQP